MEQVKRTAAKNRDYQETDSQESENLVNEELAEDVSCCLDNIDAVLAETESEMDEALRKFREIAADYFLGDSRENTDDQFRIWQAQYAHLGLRVGWCCGAPHFDDAEGNRFQ